MFGIDAISSYILVVALLTLFVAVLVWQPQKKQKTVSVWLASGVIGVLLGAAGAFALVHLMGFELKRHAPGQTATTERPSGPGGATGGPPGKTVSREEAEGREKGGGSPGKGGGGMGGMGAKMPAEQPKRDLAILVRKLELLTGDVAVVLTAEQAAGLTECLKDLDAAEKLSDADAKQKLDKINALLDDKQKASLQAVGLPFGPRGGFGGAKMPAGGAKGERPDADANPFKQDTEGKSLKALRDRAASKADAGKAPPKKP